MSFRLIKNNDGQSVAVEYAVLFFIVVAVMAAMTTYVKRAVQGRIHDAKNYMYREVNATYRTTHPSNLLPSEYEPYYLHTVTNKGENSTTTEQDTPWAGHEGKYQSDIDSTVNTGTSSSVSSARHANEM